MTTTEKVSKLIEPQVNIIKDLLKNKFENQECDFEKLDLTEFHEPFELCSISLDNNDNIILKIREEGFDRCNSDDIVFWFSEFIPVSCLFIIEELLNEALSK
jgi:hypothetical protein